MSLFERLIIFFNFTKEYLTFLRGGEVYVSHDPRKLILIVEHDDRIAFQLFELISQQTAYRVILASDSFATLQAIRHIHPHLIVLDYRLPGMNGLQLYDRLQMMSELRDVPFLIISEDFPCCKELEKRGFMSMRKPFDVATFLAMIERLIISA
jgi:DNA-binding response OmpR family regulator